MLIFLPPWKNKTAGSREMLAVYHGNRLFQVYNKPV